MKLRKNEEKRANMLNTEIILYIGPISNHITSLNIISSATQNNIIGQHLTRFIQLAQTFSISSLKFIILKNKNSFYSFASLIFKKFKSFSMAFILRKIKN